MTYDEIWGIAFERVRGFFAAQSDVRQLSDTAFRFKNADILIEALPEKHLGSMRIKQSRIVIRGEADADNIHHRFYMRFLSAGG